MEQEKNFLFSKHKIHYNVIQEYSMDVWGEINTYKIRMLFFHLRNENTIFSYISTIKISS
jgi:hypothetical protein